LLSLLVPLFKLYLLLLKYLFLIQIHFWVLLLYHLLLLPHDFNPIGMDLEADPLRNLTNEVLELNCPCPRVKPLTKEMVTDDIICFVM
jgi:hypothetical protein